MNLRRFLMAGAVALALAAQIAAPAGAVDYVVTGAGLPYAGFSSLSREAPRVLQQFYDDSFFTSITQPVELTAMSFRLPAVAGVNYPALGDLNFARYEITLAKPSPASAAANGLTSAVFADNMQDAVLVRSGPLTIPRDSFISNASGVDAEFSFQIVFDTPYVFTPGQDLVMLVRHSGHGDVNGVETRWNFDGYAWTNGTVVNTLDVNATSGNFGPGSFNIANRIQFTVVPEPASLSVLGLGAGLMNVLRRRQMRNR
ncbi:MAG: hypothetical protein KatS3mg024_1651 [Armatimonadota bacterium]|nr:MAG: hypothetical protein KatS3mg024_1651 [Armatimonadota bacterium]